MSEERRKIDEVKQALLTISINADQTSVQHKWWSDGRRQYTFDIWPENKEGD